MLPYQLIYLLEVNFLTTETAGKLFVFRHDVGVVCNQNIKH